MPPISHCKASFRDGSNRITKDCRRPAQLRAISGSDPDLFIGPQDIDKSNSEFYGVWGTLDHRLNDIWSLTAKARYSHSKFDTFAQNLVGKGFSFGADEPLISPSTWGLVNSELAQEQDEKSVQTYATAKFDLGPTKNTALLGADFSELDDDGFMDFNMFPVAMVDLADPTFSVPYSFPGARQNTQFTRNTTLWRLCSAAKYDI